MTEVRKSLTAQGQPVLYSKISGQPGLGSKTLSPNKSKKKNNNNENSGEYIKHSNYYS